MNSGSWVRSREASRRQRPRLPLHTELGKEQHRVTAGEKGASMFKMGSIAIAGTIRHNSWFQSKDLLYKSTRDFGVFTQGPCLPFSG